MNAPYSQGSQRPRFAEHFNLRDHSAHQVQTVTQRVFIDSRDATGVTSPFEFVVNMREVGLSSLENVVSAEIKVLAMPKISGESYAVLDIRELNDSNFDATGAAANMSFAVVHFDTSLLNPGDVKPIRDFYSQRAEFNPPLSKLDRFSITVRKHDGSIVTSSDTGGITVFSMLLELKMHPRRG
jgi:hypothetical protein